MTDVSAPSAGPAPASTATVVSVNLSPRKTMRKTRGERGQLILDRGFENDAHAGDWHRQVSLLAQESIDTMVAKGLDVSAGDFAENITTSGIDLLALPVGSVIRIGDGVVLEISQIGKVCHTKCAIYYQAGDCVMPREGLFAVVRQTGDVNVGDTIEIVSLGDGTCDRTPAEAIAEFEAEKAAEAALAAAKAAAKAAAAAEKGEACAPASASARLEK
jgi:MOSC domain-containing protein YiiM